MVDKGGRPKGSHDIASDIRGAFKRAIAMRAEKKGKSLSEVMDKLMDDNPVGLLNALKGFVPKEIDANVTSRELTPEQWLEHMADKDATAGS